MVFNNLNPERVETHKYLKFYLLLFCFTISYCIGYSLDYKESNFIKYHKEMIEIETEIFINTNISEGLLDYVNLFDKYDYCFIDDCLNAAVLSFVDSNFNLTKHFMKLAYQNGFEDYMLVQLKPKNYSLMSINYFALFSYFIKNQISAQEKNKYRNEYLMHYNFDPELIIKINVKHIYEQIYKDYHSILGYSQQKQFEIFKLISNANLKFIDSLAEKEIYLGDRNMGFYTEHFLNEIGSKYGLFGWFDSILKNQGVQSLISSIPLADSTESLAVPQLSIILYHNENSYPMLNKYFYKAVAKGFWHPRMFALQVDAYNCSKRNFKYYMNVSKSAECIQKNINYDIVDSMRYAFLLPPWKVDSAKEQFQNRIGINLFINLSLYGGR